MKELETPVEFNSVTVHMIQEAAALAEKSENEEKKQ